HLEHFAVAAGPLVCPAHRFALGGPAVGKRPFVAADPARAAPGPGAVEHRRLTGSEQVVRPRDGNQRWPVLLLICLPDECVPVHDAPLAGGLFGLDVEVQVGPPAAAALFAEDADPLAALHALAGTDRLVDRLEVHVSVEPAAVV